MTKEQEFNETARQALMNSVNINGNFSRKIMRRFKTVRLYDAKNEIVYNFSLNNGEIQYKFFTRYLMDDRTKRLVRMLLVKDFMSEKFPQIMVAAAVAIVASLWTIDNVKHKSSKNQTQQNVSTSNICTKNAIQFQDVMNQQNVR